MVLQNNFMHNGGNAHITFNLEYALKDIFHAQCHYNHPILQSTWDGNYWDQPRSEPYAIGGFFMVSYILPSILQLFNIWVYDRCNYYQYDEHPAQQPYDIPGMT